MIAQSPKSNQGGASLSINQSTGIYTEPCISSCNTIDKDSAPYMVSTSSLKQSLMRSIGLPQEVDSQTTEAIILTDSMSLLQKVKSEMRSPEWHVSMLNIHP